MATPAKTPEPINCSDDAQWEAYLSKNPALASFRHLRPAGAHLLPTVTAPLGDVVKMVLVGPEGLALRPVFDELTRRRAPKRKRGDPPHKALDYHLGMTVGEERTARRVVWSLVAAPYRWSADPGSVYSRMPQTDETRLFGLRDLARFFSASRVRVVRFRNTFRETAVDWMKAHPKAPLARYDDHCRAMDAFYDGLGATACPIVDVTLSPRPESAAALTPAYLARKIVAATVDDYLRTLHRERPDLSEASVKFFSQAKA